jgi:hypothetical protein
MRVEMLFAMDDQTWRTSIVDVPSNAVPADYASWQWDAEVIGWVAEHACPRDCVLVAVYNSDPDADWEQPTAEDIDVEMEIIPDSDPDISYLEQEGFEERFAEFQAGGFGFVAVVAVARWEDRDGEEQERRSAGLWGIESDSGQNYFDEIFAEEKAQLIAELRNEGVLAPTPEEKTA